MNFFSDVYRTLLCKARTLKFSGSLLIIFGTPCSSFFVKYILGVVEGVWNSNHSLSYDMNLQNVHDLPTKNGKFSLNVIIFGIFGHPLSKKLLIRFFVFYIFPLIVVYGSNRTHWKLYIFLGKRCVIIIILVLGGLKNAYFKSQNEIWNFFKSRNGNFSILFPHVKEW